MALAVVLLIAPVDAASPTLLPVAALTSVSALGVTAGETPAYVATPSGLFRSADPTYSRWEQMNQVTGITVASPNSHVPNDLLYSTANGIFRSLDGGRTTRHISSCVLTGLARARSAPGVLYGITIGGKEGCPFNADIYPVIIRSATDGQTWTLAYQPNGPYEQGSMFGPIVVDPFNTGHVIAVMVIGDGPVSTLLIQTLGTGKPWMDGQLSPVAHVQTITPTFDPVRPNNLWVSWAFGCQGELDRNGAAVAADFFTNGAPGTLAFDPISGRLYVTVRVCPPGASNGPTQIYTVVGATSTPLSVGAPIPIPDYGFPYLAVTGNGYLLTGGPKTPLTVLKLNGPGIWGRATFLSSSARRLGSPISPPTVCHGSPCQYFEKGALVKGNTPVPLVAGLLTAPSAALLPVGGSTSSVTYGSLAKLASGRVPPPGGFRHGVLVGPTGTFVPFSAQLAAKPGYVVPAFFWRFLTNPSAVPGGWLHDIGLPLTPAVPATVTKGALGKRAITIQAFQDAILTDDPRNPPATQVERANIGSDYAAIFPAATQ